VVKKNGSSFHFPGFSRRLDNIIFRDIIYIMDEKLYLDRLDKIITLLEEIAKPPSLASRIVSGIATGAGILGVLGIIDILKNWFGG